MSQKLYYTTGELSNLFKIPKQTMFYYERTGLLRPEFIAKNGYRYYDIPQYLTLEIILFLRKLNIPVPEIKKFLANRSVDHLLSLLEKKELDCKAVIASQQELVDELQQYRDFLLRSRNILLNQILLESLPEEYMFLSKIPEGMRGGTGAITVRAAHVKKVFSRSFVKDRPTGWIVRKEDFFAGHCDHSSAVATVFGSCRPDYPCNFTRPAGLYVSLHLKGAYFYNASKALRMIRSFLEKNELTPVSDVYVFPVISYWTTNDPDEYINTISIQVAPLKSSGQ